MTARLSAYGAAWATAHRDACEATRIRGAQSDAVMDRRMRCLGRRLLEVEAAVSVLSGGDPRVVDSADHVVDGLGDVGACSEARLAEAAEGPVLPREVRAALDTALARAVAERDAGRDETALASAAKARELAAAAADRGAEAEAVALLGELTDRTGKIDQGRQLLEEALVLATETRRDELAARTAAVLAYVTAVRANQQAAGASWERLAFGLVRRAGSPPRLDAFVLHRAGQRERAAGHYSDAKGHLERALVRLVDAGGSTELARAGVLVDLGGVERDRGEWGDAAARLAEAREIEERTLGPDHPAVAVALRSEGDLAWRQGKPDTATPKLERALSIQERALGPQHLEVAYTQNQLANVLSSLEQYGRALPLYEKACAAGAKTLADDHPEVAMCRMNVAMAKLHLGKLDDARAMLERSRDIVTRALGAEHHFVGMIEGELGVVASARRDHKTALEHHLRAVAIDEKSRGPDHPDLADVLSGLGGALVDLGRARDALVPLERALRLREKGGFPAQRARPKFALARARWELGDKRAAVALAEEARELFSSAGIGGRTSAAEVTAWLASHP